MQEWDDSQLLRHYTDQNSEEAFAALVARHINKVYFVALRHTGNPHRAEEITQAVFVILARKARNLRRHTCLSGWLYQTARLTAVTFLRSEIRRARREQEAHMQTFSDGTESETWTQMAPFLDTAIAELRPKDRDALVLRYFDGKSMRAVGAVLGASEDAAKKRVNRAVEKLRACFMRRGIVLSSAAICSAISVNSVQAAPAHLAASVVAGAMAPAASVSGLTLIKGALKIMAWTKAKTAAVAVTAVILATGTTTVIVKHMATGRGPFAGTLIDDSFFEANAQKLLGAPANLLILRQTHSSRVSGPLWISGQKGMEPNSTRMSGRCASLESVLEAAYGFPASRMMLPPDMPKDRFDFLVTVPGNAREQLQAEITKQLGLAGRREQRDQDVLLLKLRTFGAPGLKASVGAGTRARSGSVNGKYSAENLPISGLAAYFERSFKRTVIDQTGLSGRYNFAFDDRVLKSEQELERTLANEFGLELVPSREAVEMLVVEKVAR